MNLSIIVILFSVLIVHSNSCRVEPHKPHFIDIGFPTPAPIPYESAIIRCFNVPPTLIISHSFQQASYPRDLVIENSTIPIIPSNSSLSKFKLRKLMLNNLGIEDISSGAFIGLEELQVLDLHSNKLKKISKWYFTDLKNLGILDLSSNELETISNGDFDSLKDTLKRLYLERNNIKRVGENCFKHLTRLLVLRLNENQLTVLPKNLLEGMNLDGINISNNPLTKIEGLGADRFGYFVARATNLKSFEVNLTHVYKLVLSDGQLEEVDFSFSSGWSSSFDLSTNKISTVKNWNLLESYYINLSNNRITTLVIPEDVNLMFVDHNKIKRIENLSRDKLKKLEVLVVSFNEIDEIDCNVFQGAPNLRRIELQHNEITTLHANTFSNTSRLFYLDLSFNKIETIEPNAFQGAVRLSHVDLRNNKLTVLTPQNFEGLRFEVWMSIAGNNVSQTNYNEVKNLVQELVIDTE